ncbi:MAG: hypothetical protein H6Q61_1306, partial [Firmicutes bacterium]|nr:hypothetical protein [Bacillota bacterium]
SKGIIATWQQSGASSFFCTLSKIPLKAHPTLSYPVALSHIVGMMNPNQKGWAVP